MLKICDPNYTELEPVVQSDKEFFLYLNEKAASVAKRGSSRLDALLREEHLDWNCIPGKLVKGASEFMLRVRRHDYRTQRLRCGPAWTRIDDLVSKRQGGIPIRQT